MNRGCDPYLRRKKLESLKCEGIKIWRDQALDKRFKNQSRNRRRVGCKNKKNGDRK
jgi:hypothetical protein